MLDFGCARVVRVRCVRSAVYWPDHCSAGAMKKSTLLTIVVITFLLLLVARLIYLRVDHLKREKAWYISELHYDFSARVDSLVRPGRAFITVTSGDFDPDREWQLKGSLQYYAVLHLFISRDSWYDVRVPLEASRNDSLHVRSDLDQVSLYRNGELVTSRPLSEFLRQRPFYW